MSRFHRSISRFQTEIDQRIILEDDKISRVREYISTLRAAQSEIQEQTAKIQNAQNKHILQVTGKMKLQSTSSKSKRARIETEHEQALQQLIENHHLFIQNMTTDFNKAMTSIDPWAEKQLQKYINSITTRIELTKSKIEALQSEEADIADVHITDDAQDQRQINILEEELFTRNKERLAMLEEAKSQLADTVNILETNISEHHQELDDYSLQIQNIDHEYMSAKKKTKTNHGYRLQPLLLQLKDLKSKTNEIKRNINRIETNYKSQIQKASLISEQIRSDLISAKNEKQKDTFNDTHATELELQLRRLNEILKSKELSLFNARGINSQLKREVARINSEREITKRRQFLKLD